MLHHERGRPMTTPEARMRVVGRWVIGLAILALFVAALQAVVPLGHWPIVLAVASLLVALGYYVAVERRLRRHR